MAHYPIADNVSNKDFFLCKQPQQANRFYVVIGSFSPFSISAATAVSSAMGIPSLVSLVIPLVPWKAVVFYYAEAIS